MPRLVSGLRGVLDLVKRGEAVDLIAVVAISLVATILGLVGIGSVRLILGLNATAIGLLAIAFLNQRHAMGESASRLESAALGARFLDHPPFEYSHVFSSSHLVYLAGLDLARTYSNHESDMRDFLKRGGTLRVLLYSPDGPTLDLAVSRSKRAFSKDRQRALIISASEDFNQLLDCAAPGKFEVRYSRYPFHHGVIASNYTQPSGFICLKHYTFRADNYDKPWMRLTSTDGNWYTQWAAELDALWEASEETTRGSPSSNPAEQTQVHTEGVDPDQTQVGAASELVTEKTTSGAGDE